MSRAPVEGNAEPDIGSAHDRRRRSKPRTTAFRMASSLIGIAIALGLGEIAARIYFHQTGRQQEMIRSHLANQNPRQARIIGQPYLLYAPAPGYRSGRNYHNEQGFRGRPVPMTPAPGVVRVLCLGGSTTYGTSVEAPEEAYPARLEAILQSRMPEGVKGVEVLNAGLEYATTAELLTHYHFKFHYFRPHLVVINTGGNDAMPAQTTNYHPDYSHWRRQPQLPRPLSPLGQRLMRSRLIAFGVIQLLYGNVNGHLSLDNIDGTPPAFWYEGVPQSAAGDLHPAFAHNLNRLIDEILQDGAGILLVPYRLAPELPVVEEAEVRRNEQTFLRIATERGLHVAPFPADSISPENWVDGSHLNADGCRQKAEHIADYAAQVLWPPGAADQ